MPTTKLCRAYGSVELIWASDGAVMPIAVDALLLLLPLNGFAVANASGLRFCEVGKKYGSGTVALAWTD